MYNSTAEPAAPPSRDLSHPHITCRIARFTLSAFIVTFILSRLMVLLIMTHHAPSILFLHLKGTHVHHLNYGIFILSVTGALLLFRRPLGKKLSIAAFLYGIGLALTFDEFGMWLHLGGPYWQRAASTPSSSSPRFSASSLLPHRSISFARVIGGPPPPSPSFRSTSSAASPVPSPPPPPLRRSACPELVEWIAPPLPLLLLPHFAFLVFHF